MKTLPNGRHKATWGIYTLTVTSEGNAWAGDVSWQSSDGIPQSCTYVAREQPDLLRMLVEVLYKQGCKAFVDGRNQPISDFLRWEQVCPNPKCISTHTAQEADCSFRQVQ